VVDLPDLGSAWHSGWLQVVDGAFVASMTNESGDTVISRSADGLEWDSGDPIGGYIDAVTTDAVELFASSFSTDRPVLVRSDDRGRTWIEFDVPGISGDAVVAAFVGPSGLAVTGALISEPSADEPRPFLIEKDGYGVNITDENFLTIVDLATGETVLALPPEADPADSEFVIVEENSATLLDPGTLEPLLTITDSDWEQAFEQAFDQRYSEPEFIIGWSADEEHWGWQTTTEAFGVNGYAQLAVGDGAVVAMYQSFERAETGTVRIFTAHVG
jgi:hypothetical protein